MIPAALRWGLLLSVSITLAGCHGNRGSSEELRTGLSAGSSKARSEQVYFTNSAADITLAGTLSLPAGKGPHQAVVLITGTGPQDRDETVAGHKPFRVLAEYLVQRGIAVLRYDDRGVAESTGKFATATLHDFADDARAAVEFLRSRREIDANRIGLGGHSEGGLVAPLVALAVPNEVAFLVLLAAPGVTGEQIYYLQDATEARVRGVDPAVIERSEARKRAIFSIIKAEPDQNKAAEKLRAAMKSMLTEAEAKQMADQGLNLDKLINQQIRLLNNEATRVFLTNNPVPILARVTVPVLALTGERDVQVPSKENLPLIEAALAKGACPHYSVRELPRLNHLFQTAETGLPRDYAKIEETMSPVALDAIGDWIARVAGLHPAR